MYIYTWVIYGLWYRYTIYLYSPHKLLPYIYIYSVFYMGYNITGYIDRSLRRLDRGWNRPSCYRTLRRAEKTQRIVGKHTSDGGLEHYKAGRILGIYRYI